MAMVQRFFDVRSFPEGLDRGKPYDILPDPTDPGAGLSFESRVDAERFLDALRDDGERRELRVTETITTTLGRAGLLETVERAEYLLRRIAEGDFRAAENAGSCAEQLREVLDGVAWEGIDD